MTRYLFNACNAAWYAIAIGVIFVWAFFYGHIAPWVNYIPNSINKVTGIINKINPFFDIWKVPTLPTVPGDCNKEFFLQGILAIHLIDLAASYYIDEVI